jgi:hypothetical protein
VIALRLDACPRSCLPASCLAVITTSTYLVLPDAALAVTFPQVSSNRRQQNQPNLNPHRIFCFRNNYRLASASPCSPLPPSPQSGIQSFDLPDTLQASVSAAVCILFLRITSPIAVAQFRTCLSPRVVLVCRSKPLSMRLCQLSSLGSFCDSPILPGLSSLITNSQQPTSISGEVPVRPRQH